MKNTLYKHYISLALIILGVTFSYSQDVPLSERNALIALYNSTNGPNWTNNTNWNTAALVSDWYGVLVDQNQVVEVILSNNQLSGTIPPELGSLSHLNQLALNNNNLVGSIPSELGNLTSINGIFELEYNQLTGNIPSELGNLIGMQYLGLDNNQLTGNIPESLGNLINLEAMDLSNNQLTGSIPNTFINIQEILFLRVNKNQLSGTIPDFTNLFFGQSLDDFLIGNNEFIFSDFENEHTTYNSNIASYIYSPQAKVDLTETVDVTDGGNITLTSTELISSNNSYQWYKDGVVITGATSKDYTITGATTTDAGTYHFLATNSIITSLTLERNPITLTVSQDICGVSTTERDALMALYTSTNGPNWINDTNWGTTAHVCDWYGVTVVNGRVTRIELDDNQLSGSLPPEIGDFSNLLYLRMRNNSLSGSLPPEIGNLSTLTYLDFWVNQLSGSLPPELGNLINVQKFWLSSNQFTGSIPLEITQLPNLEEIWLSSNQLSGSIPLELGNLANLRVLNLGNNQFSGTLPKELGDLMNLEYLYLSDLHNITGAIPPEYGQLVSLKLLYIYDNQLSGTIPVELGNLINLRDFRLYTTQISGEIPSQLGNLTSLVKMRINDNQLSGQIPSQLSGLTNLEELLLHGNLLTGSIPNELGDLANATHIYLYDNQLSGIIPNSISALSNLEQFLFKDNQFIFSDFENDFLAYQNMLSLFWYSPQAKVDLAEIIDLTEADDITLTSTQLISPNNSYQWYKDGVAIIGATSKDYIITGATTTDAGVYHFLATNSIITGLTLERNPITLTISPNTGDCPEKENAEIVLTDLLNHLINKFKIGGPIPNPYNPTEMQAFAQYVDDPAPAIYDLELYKPTTATEKAILSFSFGNGTCEQAIELDFNACVLGAPNITDIRSIAGIHFSENGNSFQLIYQQQNGGCLRVVEEGEYLSPYVEDFTCSKICDDDNTVDNVFCTSELGRFPIVGDLAPSGPTIEWYSEEFGGIPLSINDELEETENLATGDFEFIYWWIDTASGNNTRTSVAVSVDDETPVGEDFQVFTNSDNATIDDLVVDGSNVQWYINAYSQLPLSLATPLVNGSTYYAEIIDVTTCRLAVTVFIGTLPPISDNFQFVCSGQVISDLSVELDLGSSAVWYPSEIGGSPLLPTTVLLNGTTYYAAQVDSLGFESVERTPVTVTLNEIEPPYIPFSSQTFYNNQSHTIANLLAIGNTINWYSQSTGGQLYSDSYTLVDGETYYAEQVVGMCSSIRVPLQVFIINEPPPTLVGCEKFKPQIGGKYVISSWVKEQSFNATPSATKDFNNSDESNLFTDLLNHLSSRLLSTDSELNEIPEEYIPTSTIENLNFDALIPFVNGILPDEKKLTVYDFTREQDSYGLTVGFKFALNKTRTHYFTFWSPKFSTQNGTIPQDYHYPILDNSPNLTLSFENVSVNANSNFIMTYNFSLTDSGDLNIDLNNEIGNDSGASGILATITIYDYDDIENYQPMDYENSAIKIEYLDGAGVLITDQSISFVPKGSIIDGWQQVFGEFVIPSNAALMYINPENNSSENNSSENINTYFDDIRVHPFNSNMKTFVYHPITQRLMSELDENNFATFYEYDAEGGLIRVKKETEKGVYTIQETRSGNSKLNN